MKLPHEYKKWDIAFCFSILDLEHTMKLGTKKIQSQNGPKNALATANGYHKPLSKTYRITSNCRKYKKHFRQNLLGRTCSRLSCLKSRGRDVKYISQNCIGPYIIMLHCPVAKIIHLPCPYIRYNKLS